MKAEKPQHSDIVYACLYDSTEKKTWAEAGDRSTLQSTLDALLSGLHQLRKQRVAYNHAPYAYYVLCDSLHIQLFYVVVARIQMEGRYGYRFLEEFQQQANMCGQDRTVLSGGLEKLLLEYRDTARQQDLVLKIQEDLDTTQLQMHQNLQQMFDRGAALETLETESLTHLEEGIQTVRETAGMVKTVVWWKRVKFKIFMCVCCTIIILVVLIVLFVLLAIGMKWIG
jgi:hypothetical protein